MATRLLRQPRSRQRGADRPAAARLGTSTGRSPEPTHCTSRTTRGRRGRSARPTPRPTASWRAPSSRSPPTPTPCTRLARDLGGGGSRTREGATHVDQAPRDRSDRLERRGTSTVKRSFEHIFPRERVHAVVMEGDSFHKYDREGMEHAIEEAEARVDRPPSHFGPQANLFAELENLFRTYGDGNGRRCYVHNDDEAAALEHQSGPSHPGNSFPTTLTCSSTRACTAASSPTASMSPATSTCSSVWCPHRPTSNGFRRSTATPWRGATHRGGDPHHSCDVCTTTCTIHRAAVLADACQLPTRAGGRYLHSFVARDIPTLDESFVIIRFRDPTGIDFPYR